MAAASKQYTATFAIGAKLLGSFKGVMAQAQARLHTLRSAAERLSSGLLTMAKRLAGLFAIVGTYFGAKVLGSLFEGGDEEAAAAEQRARKLSTLLLENNRIRQKGIQYAQTQTDRIFAANAALAKQGVYGHQILDSMSATLAVYGYSPKRIAAMSKPLADVLVVSKGIRATEEDGAALADAWGRAIKSGMTKGMKQFGFVLTDTQQKEFKGLKNAEKRNTWILKWASGLKGANAAAAQTDLGKIQAYHNEVKNMAEDIRTSMIPAQAKMAQSWREILPELKPLLTSVFKVALQGGTWLAHRMHDTFLPIFKRMAAFLQSGPFTKALGAIWKNFKDAAGKIGKAFTDMLKQFGIDAGKMTFGETIIGVMKGVAAAIKFVGDNASWLTPLVVTLTAGFLALDVAMATAELINPVALTVLGISAAIYGVIQLNKHLGELRARQDAIGAAARSLKTFDDALKPFVDRFKTNFVQAWVDLWANLKVGWNGFVASITGAGQMAAIKAVWQDIKSALSAAFLGAIQQIKLAWEGLVKAITSPITPDLSGLKGVAKGLFNIWGGATPVSPPAGAAAATPPPNTFPGMATGGIVRGHSLLQIAEHGPEAVIPLRGGTRAEGLLDYANRMLGRGHVGGKSGPTNVNYAPQITINGNATESERHALASSLRQSGHEFVRGFKAAQQEERRLSYESGYG